MMEKVCNFQSRGNLHFNIFYVTLVESMYAEPLDMEAGYILVFFSPKRNTNKAVPAIVLGKLVGGKLGTRGGGCSNSKGGSLLLLLVPH